MARSRSWIWLQVIIGWLPVGALFMALILSAHPDVSARQAAMRASQMMLAGAALGPGVRRLSEKFPWPHRFDARFVVVQVIAAIVYASAWIVLGSLLASVVLGRLVLVVGPGLGTFLVVGVWLYLTLAAVFYATQTAGRAAGAEAMAAKSQLAALRGQLHPHFLFNALHTVVQLIPRQPRVAAVAAEQIAALLRQTIEEDRDLVLLADERRFVEQYLEVEALRFGNRLRVHLDISDEAAQTLIPSFALLTLVENAVRHGAEPNLEPTDVTVHGRVSGGALALTVRDTGAGPAQPAAGEREGSGLWRLRERLRGLYGRDGRVTIDSAPSGGGFMASLVIPCVADD